MSRVARLLLSLVLLLSSTFFLPAPASACSCAVNPSPISALQESAAVFTGRVIRVDTPRGLFSRPRYPVRVVLAVDTVWKGPQSSRITVHTAFDEGACGFDFNVGWSYLVYARDSAEGLAVNSCSRTVMLSFATADLAALGPGTAAYPDPLLLLCVPGLAAAGLGLALLALFAIRRVWQCRELTRRLS